MGWVIGIIIFIFAVHWAYRGVLIAINHLDIVVVILAICFFIFLIVKAVKKSKRRYEEEKVPETEEEKIQHKIANLKKQATDKKIYEKSLEILSFFNKDIVVRTYYLWHGDDPAYQKEIEEMENSGIIQFKKRNLIIKKEGIKLSIVNEGSTVFSWEGWRNPYNKRYFGTEVSSYVPGSWEKDIDELLLNIEIEQKKEADLAKRQREKEEKARWGLK